MAEKKKEIDSEEEAEIIAAEAKKNQKSKILAEYGDLRSNVPINHPTFWKL